MEQTGQRVLCENNNLPRHQRRSQSLGSCSSKSDRYISASKSIKNFSDSLRRYDCSNGGTQNFNSPLKRTLNFGKSDAKQNIQGSSQTLYVDLRKKIKKVQSPFEKSKNMSTDFQLQRIAQSQMLLISINSIPDKIQQSLQNQSSQGCYKHKDNLIVPLSAQMQLENGKQLENLPCQQQSEENNEFIEKDLNQRNVSSENELMSSKSSQQLQVQGKQNSENISSKSISYEKSLVEKKHKKRLIRKQKKKMARSMHLKLQNLSSFLAHLNEKKVQTNRKELITELSQHLSQKKFDRLKKQLKKLI